LVAQVQEILVVGTEEGEALAVEAAGVGDERSSTK
jgi:hypothetical protein